MSKVNATLQVLRNKSQLAEDLEGGTMDLFLEIKPVADFSASCYWRLTRMAGLAAEYALPKVRRFVKKRDNLRRKLSASLQDRDQASLPALRSAYLIRWTGTWTRPPAAGTASRRRRGERWLIC